MVRRLTMCLSPQVHHASPRVASRRRWVEYSLTATLMLVGLAINTGIREESLLLCLAVLTLITMQMGLLTEVYSKTKVDADGDQNTRSWVDDSSQSRAIFTRLRPHFLGWLPFLTVWVVIVRVFNQTVQATRDHYQSIIISSYDRDIPPGILVMLIGTLVLYACFAPVQIIYQYKSPRFYWQSEVVYLVLSLVSKVFLGATLMINVILVDNES
jgi:hypothetical protein